MEFTYRSWGGPEGQKVGIEDGLFSRFLGCVDLLGGKFESESIATGLGAHLALPILRRTIEEKSGGAAALSFEEAKVAIDTCMRVLYCRDARSVNKVLYVAPHCHRSNMDTFPRLDRCRSASPWCLILTGALLPSSGRDGGMINFPTLSPSLSLQWFQ